MVNNIVQTGITHTEEQLQRLARPAVAFADAALLREFYKNEVVKMRGRSDVRQSDFTAMNDTYKATKRKCRTLLAGYKKAKEEVCK